MQKEQFRDLALDMKPVIKDFEKVLKKHGIDRIAHVVISNVGYFCFQLADSNYEMARTRDGEPIRIKYEEEI